MKLHAYLEEVLGSPIKIKLLRFLFKFPKQGSGLRELARFLGVNHRSIARAVRDLRDNNLVTLQVAGRSQLIYVNTESFLFHQLRPIFAVEMKSPAFLADLIRQHLPLSKIQLCALFGSIVEGKERPSSDIDLLIITSHTKAMASAVAALREKVLYVLGNPLSPLIITPRHFKNLNPPLKENIMKNHYLIYGTW